MQQSGHSDSTCKVYRRVAEKLTEYAVERGKEQYTVDFAHQLLADIYPVDSEFQPCQWSPSQATARRAIRLMGSFAVNSVILLNRQSLANGISEQGVALAGRYEEWLKLKGCAKNASRAHISVARGFSRHLSQLNRAAGDIADKDIVQYLNASDGCGRSTISGSLYSLKRFARFLLDEKILATGIVPLFPRGHQYRLANIVSVWKPGDVEKILGAVDRRGPIGRRGCAIILTAARLGLRQADVLGLRLDSVDWRNSRAEATQSKTGEPISLPLPEDAGWAIIDYLKYGRPQIDSPYILAAILKKRGASKWPGRLTRRLINVYAKRVWARARGAACTRLGMRRRAEYWRRKPRCP
jgi:site-specific recombinase XerD